MIDRSLRRLLGVLLLSFGVLMVQVSRVQVLDAAELRNNPDNARSILRDFNRSRGQILTSDGVVVAESESVFGSAFDFQRHYPEGELYAHSAGYYSFNLGASGVEKAYNDSLSGRSAELRLSGLNEFLGGAGQPGDVVMSISHTLQSQAADLLGDRVGSVVMIEPDTGAIVALYSSPSFDPALLASHDGAEAEAASRALNVQKGNPRRASAIADVYFPGSSFKVVTAAAILTTLGPGTGADPDATTVEPTNEYFPPLVSNRPIRNFGGRTCGGTLAQALATSCNTSFAFLAAERVGPQALVDTSQAFGFNEQPPLDIGGAVASVFPTDYGEQLRAPSEEIPAGVYANSAVLAQAALGQNNVAASPLMMSLVAAAVANGGVVPSPHVVSKILSSDGTIVETVEPEPWRTAVAPETALELRTMMKLAVSEGTARGLQTPGLELGAKTGTAQVGEDLNSSHAWVIGFAGDKGFAPDIAFAVFVAADADHPNQTGGGTAVPIARELVSTYFGLL